jgi:lipoate-protein ligase A
MNTRWHLIIDGPGRGATNMAMDESLLAAAEEEGRRAKSEERATVLRIYKWSAPTLSIGYAQKPEEVADLEFCRAQGIEIVRRPTGGRAVLHDMELTYAVVSNDPQVFNLKSSTDSYLKIAQALKRGLEALGLDVAMNHSLAGRAAARAGVRENYLKMRVPCFTSPARYELLCRGKKIIGSAQRRLRHAFLQHGSLLLDCNFALLAAVTRMDEAYLRASITHVKNECPRPVSEAEIIQALIKGFESQFHSHWTG